MSSDEDPRSTNYWLGRIDSKLDKLAEDIGHQGETLAGHAERLTTHDRELRDLKMARVSDQAAYTADRTADRAARVAEQQTAKAGLSGMKAAVVSALISAGIGGTFVVIQILTHR